MSLFSFWTAVQHDKVVTVSQAGRRVQTVDHARRG